jgi:hypothetical protein
LTNNESKCDGLASAEEGTHTNRAFKSSVSSSGDVSEPPAATTHPERQTGAVHISLQYIASNIASARLISSCQSGPVSEVKHL